jgi:hypothetical protein
VEKEMFKELAGSVREAGAILRRQGKPPLAPSSDRLESGRFDSFGSDR